MTQHAAHSAALRSKAIELAKEVGAAEAARQLNLNRGTVSAWLSKSGGGALRREQTRQATEMLILTRAQRVARLSERLLHEAETEVGRLRQPMTVRKAAASGKLVTWRQAEPEPSDRRAIATTAAILIDKSQLLAGEATSRSEVSNPDQARENIARLNEKLAQRAQGLHVVGE